MRKYLFILVILSFLNCEYSNSPIGPDNKDNGRFLLTKAEMKDYTLKNSFKNHWIINENNKLQEGIQQTWVSNESIDKNEIVVGIFVFNSVLDAINGASYASKNHPTFFLWGTFDKGIIGDEIWISASEPGNALIFVRGNVGVHIMAPVAARKEHSELQTVALKVLDKIDNNLSSEILMAENDSEKRKLSLLQYNNLTNDVIKANELIKFKLYKSQKSKWIIDNQTFMIGIRKEWKDNNGIILGIDLCGFASHDLAKIAANIRSRNTNFSKLISNEHSSIDDIIDDWEKKGTEYTSMRNNISLIMFQNSIAAHIYQYHPNKIDTEILSSIYKQIDSKLKN